MIEYDLTETRLFEADVPIRTPNDAEMFALTVALLLVNDAAYSDLRHIEVQLTQDSLHDVAECIEYRIPSFTRDLGAGEALRERLFDLVGLRICVLGHDCGAAAKPT
jgi:hypothetical protein